MMLRMMGWIMLLLSFPALASSAVPAGIEADFGVLSGVIVMPVGDEYLIDLDASDRIVEGDLFSVVKPGEKVIHPVTGEVLGSLDEVKGQLQVTRIRTGYSYARALPGTPAFAKGDAIRRYESVPALFWDYDGNGAGLGADLRAALPGLAWLGAAEAERLRPQQPAPLPGSNPPLLFIAQNGQLEVHGASFQLLHSYPLGTAPVVMAPPVSAPVAIARPVVVAPGLAGRSGIVATAPAEPAQTGGVVRPEENLWEGVWNAYDLETEPLGVEVADLDGDGRRETIIATTTSLILLQFDGQKRRELGQIELTGIDKLLSIDRADLNQDGHDELYLSAVRKQQPSALIVEASAGGFRITADGIPYFLRALDVPGEGRVLLGQRLGGRLSDFGTEIYRMQRSGSDLRPAGEYQHPSLVNLFGFQPFRSGAANLLTYLTANDYLRVVSPGGEELWESSDKFGGSQNAFTRPEMSGGPGDGVRDVILPLRLEAGVGDEVLVPVNQGKSFTRLLDKLGPGRVVAFRWDGRAMREQWHTRPQDGYLGDFRKADMDNDGVDELAMLMTVSKGMFKKGRGTLVVYELQ